MTYEYHSLRRQRLRYNSSNADNPLTAQLVVDGLKKTPSAATITLYPPGESTALVSAASMTVSGTLMSYVRATTTTADYPISNGWRADISATVSGTAHPLFFLFDVVKLVIRPSVSLDQLIDMDAGIRGVAWDDDDELANVISGQRDEFQMLLESKAVGDRRLLDSMMVDVSRFDIPFRRLVLAAIWDTKGPERAQRHRDRYDELMAAALSVASVDANQDGFEDSEIGDDVTEVRFRR